MIIGVSGLTQDAMGNRGSAGAGKDATADRLERAHQCVKIAFADPLKRILRDVYDFSTEQLWGPSELRNKPDERYPRRHTWEGPGIKCFCCGASIRADSQCYLTPRYALQLLGTEWGRHCYYDTWVDYAVRTAKAALSGIHYTQMHGLDVLRADSHYKAVVIPDVRFLNEVSVLRAAGAKLVRVKRSFEKLSMVTTHPSEIDLANTPDNEFDYVIDNDRELAQLWLHVDHMFDVLQGRIIPYDDRQADVPPFKRE